MRPVIALTCSTQPAPTNPAQLRDFAGQAYAAAVRRAGGAPLLVPPAEESGPVDAVLAHAHGLLLTGGVDLAP